jgi:hypothetical protein
MSILITHVFFSWKARMKRLSTSELGFEVEQ